MQARRHAVGVQARPLGQRLIGQREQELLPVGELHEIHVDGAVGDHTSRHVETERAVDLAGEDLPADRVAHVVRHERDVGEADLVRARLDDVGLREERVLHVGLGGEAVARVVEQDDAAARPQHIEREPPVEARGREAVQHQYRLGFFAHRGHVDHEHFVAEKRSHRAPREPVVDQRHAANMPC